MRILAALLLLSACSSVSTICDKRGTCLEAFRNVSATSTVTEARLLGPDGKMIPGTGSTSTQGGTISFFDPLAADVSTTAKEAGAVRGW